MEFVSNLIESVQHHTGIESWMMAVVALILMVFVVKFVVSAAIKMVLIAAISACLFTGGYSELFSEKHESVGDFVDHQIGNVENKLGGIFDKASGLFEKSE